MNTQLLALKALRPLLMQPRVIDRMIAHAQAHPYSTIRSRDGTADYMHRGWLFNPYHKDADGQYVRGKWGNTSVRLHHILLPDDDEHLHNHPFDALSLILRGWYREETPTNGFERARLNKLFPGPGEWTTRRFFNPGDINIIKKTDFHRVTSVSEGGVWTLFITNDVEGEWGFDVDGMFIEQTKYFATRGKRVAE